MRYTSILALFVVVAAASPQSVTGQRAAQNGLTHSVRRVGQPENRRRYVWHNDRWWYWTRANRWAYFDGRKWNTYDPRRPPADGLALGYRRAPAFERPPTVPPRPPRASAIGSGELGPIELFELGGGALERLEPAAGTVLRVPEREPSDIRVLPSPPVAGTSDRLGGTDLGSPAGRSAATGGGGFGGPSGRSLGAGSAAGGASTPQ
ncbi:MAG TPA: hypothetical protein VJ783_27030 [Pirellulales bacterium]|nr:hypothetical protein [Pirellulales bacterium]